MTINYSNWLYLFGYYFCIRFRESIYIYSSIFLL